MADRDALQDDVQALTDILGGQDVAELAESTDTGASSTPPASSDAPAEEEPDPQDSSSADSDEDHSGETPDTEEPEERRLGIRALTDEQYVALKRAKIPQAVMDSLEDGALIELAESTHARLNEEHARYERDVSSARNGKEDPTPREAAEVSPGLPPADGPAAADLRSVVGPLRAKLELDDSDRSLDQFGEAIVSASARAVEKRIAAIEAAASQANQHVGSVVSQMVRGELTDAYPELADPANWSKVYGRAKKIAPAYTGDVYSAMRECLSDAAHLELGAPQDPKKPAKARKTPVPSKPGLSKTPKKKAPATDVEFARESFAKYGLDNLA